MLARHAVRHIPSLTLLSSQQLSPVSSLESALMQVFIPKDFKPFRIRSYEKTESAEPSG